MLNLTDFLLVLQVILLVLSEKLVVLLSLQLRSFMSELFYFELLHFTSVILYLFAAFFC